MAPLAAIQATATIEITANAAKTRLRLARFVEAGEDDLQHPLSDIAMTLGHGQYRTLQKIEQLSLIHISEPTRHFKRSRMPSSA